MEPFPPQFVPGDLVEIIGVEYPPGSGRVKGWLGLFQDVGFPESTEGVSKQRVGEILNDRLVSTIQNGQRCLVVAVRYCPKDTKWYYLLRGMGFQKCFGWTRSAIRLKKDQACTNLDNSST